jgi:ABC-2 type transport system permease protein
MLFRIIFKEIRQAVRNRQVLLFGLVVALLLLAASAAGYVSFAGQRAQMARAQAERRAEWLGQGEKHPHMATHYGTFVFKPKTGLSFFDYGLDAYTGTSVYLEAHYQHEFMFRPAQDYSALIRFGELSGALVLQVLLPLLIIFLCFGAFTQEKESGTLRLLLSQGVSRRQLAWGKVLAYYGIVLALLVPTLALALGGAFWQAGLPWTPDLARRLALLAAGYAGYFFGFVCLGVLVSAWARSSRNALLGLLTLWITFVVVLPKTAAALGDNLYPLPSMQAYQTGISRDVDQGLPGDTTKAGRTARLQRAMLAQYRVDSVQQLPLNFDWVAAQAGEDYLDRVQALHRDSLRQVLERQNRLSSYASFLDPYLALRNLSMALTGTDLYTSLDFQRQAGAYRLGLMRTLHADAAQNSKYGQFYEYHPGRSLWASVPDFNYQLPAVGPALRHYGTEIGALLLWVLVLPLALHLSVNRFPLS